MTDDGRRDELRRAAFGRPDADGDTARDERRAAEAQALLSQLEATIEPAPTRAAAPATAPGEFEALISDVDQGGAADSPDAEGAADAAATAAGDAAGDADDGTPNADEGTPVALGALSPRDDLGAPVARRWSSRMLALGVILGIIGGAGLTALVTRGVQDSSTDVPGGTTIFVPDGAPLPASGTPEAEPADPEGALGGDPETAALWFAGDQSEEDRYPFALPDLEPDRTRLVGGTPGLWQLWVSDRADGTLCLLAVELLSTEGATGGLATCASPEDFRQSGLTLESGSNSARWDGITVRSTTQYEAG